MAPRTAPATGTERSTPWWRVGYVWLIIGCMAAALIAGGITVMLALQGSDAPAPGEAAGQGALEPAMQARNRTGSRNAEALGLGGGGRSDGAKQR
ncbi:MAG: hypothetical protein OZ923_13720 [Comamonadaceae bacterium]|nr:hypothetical protein [Comamonadaceae bacterium]